METKNKQPIDIYSMLGHVSLSTVRQCADFLARNLVYNSDLEVSEMRQKLLSVYSKNFSPWENGHGLILSGGSEANEIALLLARESTKRQYVIVSNLGHSSIAFSCKKLGLKIITVDVDPKDFLVNPRELKQVLQRYKGKIACLVITTGATQLGTIEDIPYQKELADYCEREKIFIHVDGAYGAMMQKLLGEASGWLQDKKISSLTIDPHKFGSAIGCGLLLFKDKNYIEALGSEVGYFNGTMTMFGTTRSAFAAATALATIEKFGIKIFKQKALDCYQKASSIAYKLREKNIETLVPIKSGVIPIKINSKEKRDLILNKLIEHGYLASPIFIKGEKYSIYGLRIVITPKPLFNRLFVRKVTNAVIRSYQEFNLLSKNS